MAQDRYLSVQEVGRLASLSNVSSLSGLNLTLADLGLELSPWTQVVSDRVQVGLVALFSTTALASLLANLLVVLVLVLGKRSGDLRAFLINLAVSDITMAAFSIPFSYTTMLLGRWVFPPPLCPLANGVQVLSVITSVYTLLVIAVDRYHAVIHPFERHVTKSATKRVVCAIWILGCSVSAVQAFFTRVETIPYTRPVAVVCVERWPGGQDSARVYTVAILFVTFVLPLVTMGFVYTSIACRLWRSNAPGNAHAARDSSQLRNKKKVIKMMVLIVVLFAICWLPLQTFNLLLAFRPAFSIASTAYERQTFSGAYFACLWLANVNSLVNPLVYSFMSDSFTSELREVFLRGRRARAQSTSTRSTRSSRTSTHQSLLQGGPTV